MAPSTYDDFTGDEAVGTLASVVASPTTPLGPALDRRRLPHRPDGIGLIRLGEFALVRHLSGSLLADADAGGDVGDAKSASAAHRAEA